jgi:hypothetical protein
MNSSNPMLRRRRLLHRFFTPELNTELKLTNGLQLVKE